MKDSPLPCDIEAEAEVIAAALTRPDFFGQCRHSVLPDDFYRPVHTAIWQAIEAVTAKGRRVDVYNVRQALRASGSGDEDLTYLASLMSTAGHAGYTSALEIVAATAHRRRMVYAGQQVIALALAESPIAETAMQDQAERAVLSVRRQQSDTGLVKIFGPMVELTDEIQARRSHPGTMRGPSTSFPALDRLSCGLPSELIIIGARPSMGKSGLAYTLMLVVAKLGLPVALFSLDAATPEVTERLLTMESGLESWAVKTGRVDDEQWGRANKFATPIANLPIWINDSMEVSVPTMASQIRSAIRGDLGMIIVDYIQLIGGRGRNRNQELGEISRGLKQLVRDFRCPVLALSQLSREVEKRDNKRPLMSDLRDSGSIEAEAHQAWLLYRETYYKNQGKETDPDGPRKPINADTRQETEIIVGKNKNGPTGYCKIDFMPMCVKFVNPKMDGF